jgi:hypothetical protein
MDLLGLQPGTWADWANAIATALAFTVALVLFVIGLRDRRNLADDRLRDQARRVWIEPKALANWATGDGQQFVKVIWVIHNTSDQVITNCRVRRLSEFVVNVSQAEPDVALQLPESTSQGQSFAFSGTAEKDTPLPPVQMIFTDAAGVQWWRNSHGELKLYKRPRHR